MKTRLKIIVACGCLVIGVELYGQYKERAIAQEGVQRAINWCKSIYSDTMNRKDFRDMSVEFQELTRKAYDDCSK